MLTTIWCWKAFVIIIKQELYLSEYDALHTHFQKAVFTGRSLYERENNTHNLSTNSLREYLNLPRIAKIKSRKLIYIITI